MTVIETERERETVLLPEFFVEFLLASSDLLCLSLDPPYFLLHSLVLQVQQPELLLNKAMIQKPSLLSLTLLLRIW